MYDHAIKINPNEFISYVQKGKRFKFILGVALCNLGKFNEAIVMYDLALKIKPNEFNSYYNKGKRPIIILGVALENLGKFNKAIIMYDHAIKVNPDESMAFINKGKRFNYFRSYTIQFRKVWWGNKNEWSCSWN